MARRRALIEAKENRLFASSTTNAGNIADGDSLLLSVTCTGAKLGDFALASCSISLGGLQCTASVDSDDTVKVHLDNNTGGGVNLDSATFRVLVFKDNPA